MKVSDLKLCFGQQDEHIYFEYKTAEISKGCDFVKVVDLCDSDHKTYEFNITKVISMSYEPYFKDIKYSDVKPF